MPTSAFPVVQCKMGRENVPCYLLQINHKTPHFAYRKLEKDESSFLNVFLYSPPFIYIWIAICLKLCPFCLYSTKHKGFAGLAQLLGTTQVPVILSSLSSYIRTHQWARAGRGHFTNAGTFHLSLLPVAVESIMLSAVKVSLKEVYTT